MSTKSREVIFGSRIRGSEIHADGAREHAKQAVREADGAEAEAWPILMEGGRDLSTLASLRALRPRTLEPAWTRRAVGESVKFCPRAGCGKSACPVR
jgi:hypothetical protein